MSNEELIIKFYSSFAAKDAEGMVSCYAGNVVFEDPAFGKLEGEQARSMWRMLLARSKGGIKLTFSDVKADERNGSARWVAEYIFAQTGRRVVNVISAQFEFSDGKIKKHTDHFSMWKWSRQALGFKGWLLGWSGFMKKQIQKQTGSLLKKYMEDKKI
jgi:hypothetical protein